MPLRFPLFAALRLGWRFRFALVFPFVSPCDADSPSAAYGRPLGEVLLDLRERTLEIREQGAEARRVVFDSQGMARSIEEPASGLRVDLMRQAAERQMVVRVSAPDLPEPYDLALEFDFAGRLSAVRDALGSARLRAVAGGGIERRIGDALVTEFRPGREPGSLRVTHRLADKPETVAEFARRQDLANPQRASGFRPTRGSLRFPVARDTMIEVRLSPGTTRHEITLHNPWVRLEHGGMVTRCALAYSQPLIELPRMSPTDKLKWELAGEGIDTLQRAHGVTDFTASALGLMTFGEVPETPWFMSTYGTGLNAATDIAAFMASTEPLDKRIWHHGMLGSSSEAFAGKLVGEGFDTALDWTFSPPGVALEGRFAGWGGVFVSPLVSLAYDHARGEIDGGFWDPDGWEHSLDWAAGVLSLAAFKNPEVAQLAVTGAGLLRDASRPGFERAGAWFAETGNRATGQWLYQAMVAQTSGMDSLRFEDLMGPLMNRVRHNHGTFHEFDKAFFEGDTAKMAALLKSNPIREALKEHGVSDTQLAMWSDDLLNHHKERVQDSAAGSLDRAEQMLGGVALASVPDWDLPLGNLTGVVFDPTSKRIVLVGDGASACVGGLQAEDLAVAFAAVFGTVEGNTRNLWGAPSFSLDPAEPKNPDGPWYRAVYHPPFMEGTALGDACYQADWLMKLYSFGRRATFINEFHPTDEGEKLAGDGSELRNNRTTRQFLLEKWAPAIPGWKTIPELLVARGGDYKARNRLWLVVEKKVTARFDGGSCLLDPVVMGVRVKRQEIGADGQLHDVEEVDPVATRFAREIMTPNYDRLAESEPAFARLKTMAQAVAVAEWVKSRCGDPDLLDLAWVGDLLGGCRTGISAVSRVEAREPYADGRRQGTTYVTGGADLAVNLDLRPDDRAAELRQAVTDALAGSPSRHMVKVSFAGKPGVAVVLPSGADGAARWQDRGTCLVGGTRYRVIDRRVTASTDQSGEREFDWQDGRLAAIRRRLPDGRIIEVERPTNDGSAKVSCSVPGGGHYEWQWEPGGQKCRVLHNGYPMATLDELPAGSMQGVSGRVDRWQTPSSGTVALVGHDQGGLVERIETRTEGVDGTPMDLSFGCTRYPDASLATLSLPGREPVRFSRYPDGRVFRASAGATTLRFDYPSTGAVRPSSITLPDGGRIEVAWLENRISSLRLCRNGQALDAEFSFGRLHRLRTPEGQELRVEYHPSGSPRLLADASSVRAEWDARGRLLAARFPGEAQLRATYPAETPGKACFSFFALP